ncbi:hypothetical protein [Nocardia sp. NPDC050435]|uniref:hypothetical protein n=1 Tax=Nocardia sp. NPDC050435 TaxID=3155040 RepID=UPI0034044799
MATRVSRKAAESVLEKIKTHFSEQGWDWFENGPNLRGHDHEELRPGSWSIDWEDGPDEWAYTVSCLAGETPGFVSKTVLLQPINLCVLGVHPV